MQIKKIIINTKEKNIEAPPEARLIDVLRENLGLTGTKEGCGEGECGACSVLLNDDVVNSCLVLFGQLQDGDKILTIEGLGHERRATSDPSTRWRCVPSLSRGSLRAGERRAMGDEPREVLHPLQQAFIDCGAVQCGFCTPGMLIAAYALLKRNARPTRAEIAEAISGNLCRCTGYVKIVDAIEKAATEPSK